jgi:hypothetical protein
VEKWPGEQYGKGNTEMKAVKLKRMLACWIALLFVMLAAQTAQAQKMAAAIKDVKIGTVKTPDYKDSKEPNKNYWCRVLVNFSTSGAKWINELDVKWTIATFNADGKLVVMRETVTYEDIEESRIHRACVYIKPTFPRKYQNRSQFDTSSIAVFVELVYGGKRIAAYENGKVGKLPDKWYEKVQNGPTLKGQLLPKSKTPFAPMDYDFFEHEKVN